MAPEPLDVLAKVAIGRKKKDEGDEAFKKGDTTAALRAYHEATMYLVGIDKSALASVMGAPPPPPPTPGPDGPKEAKTEVDEILEKIWSNMSACHIKKQNWKRALELADKALSKNENNYKAIFRKGKAQAGLGWPERAEKTLLDLLQKNPTDATVINAEIARIRAEDKQREKAHNQKFKGFLARAKDREDSKAHGGAYIEEVVDVVDEKGSDPPPEVSMSSPPPQSHPVSVIPENAEIVDLTGP